MGLEFGRSVCRVENILLYEETKFYIEGELFMNNELKVALYELRITALENLVDAQKNELAIKDKLIAELCRRCGIELPE